MFHFETDTDFEKYESVFYVKKHSNRKGEVLYEYSTGKVRFSPTRQGLTRALHFSVCSIRTIDPRLRIMPGGKHS